MTWHLPRGCNYFAARWIHEWRHHRCLLTPYDRPIDRPQWGEYTLPRSSSVNTRVERAFLLFNKYRCGLTPRAMFILFSLCWCWYKYCKCGFNTIWFKIYDVMYHTTLVFTTRRELHLTVVVLNPHPYFLECVLIQIPSYYWDTYKLFPGYKTH